MPPKTRANSGRVVPKKRKAEEIEDVSDEEEKRPKKQKKTQKYKKKTIQASTSKEKHLELEENNIPVSASNTSMVKINDNYGDKGDYKISNPKDIPIIIILCQPQMKQKRLRNWLQSRST